MVPETDDERERRERDAEDERAYWEEDADRAAAEEAERVEHESAIEEMEEWFWENFEDPQNETPYDGEDGAYQYIWGGPFDAAVVLGDHFGTEYRQKWIEETVERLESDGTFEWAPTSRGEFYEAPEADPTEAVPDREATGASLLVRIDQLERRLNALEAKPSNFGHNQPPDEVGVPPYDDEAKLELIVAINVIREEIERAEPDGIKLEAAESTFRKYGRAFLVWCAQKGDLIVDEAIKAFLNPVVILGVGAYLLSVADDIAAYIATFLS